MPAALSHYLHACRVYESLKQTCPQCLKNRDAFLWGAQGPDFMYAHRFFPWQKPLPGKKEENLCEYGVRLHHDSPVRTLECMREYSGGRRAEAATVSYIMGFLCHYVLDADAHPFVNCGAGLLHAVLEPSTEEICHHEIEAALDVILLRYERGALPTDISLKSIVPKNNSVKDAMIGLYRFLLERLYGKTGYEPLLGQAVRDCRTALGLMTDRTTYKKLLIQRIERKKGLPPVLSCHIRPISEGDEYDYANILQAEWMDLDGKVRTESFLQIYEQAVTDAKALVRGFLNGEDLYVLTGNKPF